MRINRRRFLVGVGTAPTVAVATTLPWAENRAHAATIVIADEGGRVLATGEVVYRNTGFAKGAIDPFTLTVSNEGRASKVAIYVEGMPVPVCVPVTTSTEESGCYLSVDRLCVDDTISFVWPLGLRF